MKIAYVLLGRCLSTGCLIAWRDQPLTDGRPVTTSVASG